MVAVYALNGITAVCLLIWIAVVCLLIWRARRRRAPVRSTLSPADLRLMFQSYPRIVDMFLMADELGYASPTRMLEEMDGWEFDARLMLRQMKHETESLMHCECASALPKPCTTCGRANLSFPMAWRSVFTPPKE